MHYIPSDNKEVIVYGVLVMAESLYILVCMIYKLQHSFYNKITRRIKEDHLDCFPETRLKLEHFTNFSEKKL